MPSVFDNSIVFIYSDVKKDVQNMDWIQELTQKESLCYSLTAFLLGGELRETQTANYFSNFSPVDCAVPSANA